MQVIKNNAMNIPGIMFDFAGNTPPTGSMHCNGRALKRVDYPELYAAVGDLWATAGGQAAPASDEFRIPSSERGGLGMFWRSGNTSQAIGAYGDDSTSRPNSAFTTNTTGNHTHSANWNLYRSSGGNANPTNWGGSTDTTNARSYPKNVTTAGNHSHSITGGGDSETRPKHCVILKCVWTGK